jgi:alkanesulfonate monooxygenase SsuD/methylene tetrahydromethanopterin reductase-like flavin-dependent oxidoreductase (luciferase family)
MKAGFFTMPIHPIDKDWRKSLREDQDAFLLADELGFAEAYVGEHVTDLAENITSSALFIASLAGRLKQMRIGTGTVNLPNSHPAHVAGQIAMLDHLMDGRLIFGISPGGLLSDAEIFGNLGNDRNAMFLEAIDMVLALWTTEAPYNLEGKFWKITTERTHLPQIGEGGQAPAAAAPADRRHGGRALLQGGDSGGGAGLGSDQRELPDAQMGCDPQGQLSRGLRAGRAAGRSVELAGSEVDLRRR